MYQWLMLIVLVQFAAGKDPYQRQRLAASSSSLYWLWTTAITWVWSTGELFCAYQALLLFRAHTLCWALIITQQSALQHVSDC